MKSHSRPDIPEDRLCERHNFALPLNRLEGDDVSQNFLEFVIHDEEGKGNEKGCQEYKYRKSRGRKSLEGKKGHRLSNLLPGV